MSDCIHTIDGNCILNNSCKNYNIAFYLLMFIFIFYVETSVFFCSVVNWIVRSEDWEF